MLLGLTILQKATPFPGENPTQALVYTAKQKYEKIVIIWNEINNIFQWN